MYQATGDPAWRAEAAARQAGIASQQNNTSTHDLGFMLFTTFGNGYRLTGDTAYRDVVLQAAGSLATRYNATVGATRSWDNGSGDPSYAFKVIIDNMINLNLLFWAAQNGGDAAWTGMAVNHALTTTRTRVRADGSTFRVRHLQRQRRVGDRPQHAAGLPQRLDLGAWPGVGGARVHAGLCLHERRAHARHGPQRRRLLRRAPAGRQRALLRLPGAGLRSPAGLLGRGHRRLRPAVAGPLGARRVPRPDLPRRREADPHLALGAAIPLAGHAWRRQHPPARDRPASAGRRGHRPRLWRLLLPRSTAALPRDPVGGRRR